MIDKSSVNVFLFGSPGQGFSSYPHNNTKLVSGYDQSGKNLGESESKYIIKSERSVIVHVLYGLSGAGQGGSLRTGRNFGVWIELKQYKILEEKISTIHGFILNFLQKGAFNPHVGLFDTEFGRIEKYKVFSFDEVKHSLDKLLDLLVEDFVETFSEFIVINSGHEDLVYELDPIKIEYKKREKERIEKEDLEKGKKEQRPYGQEIVSESNNLTLEQIAAKKNHKRKQNQLALNDTSRHLKYNIIGSLFKNAFGVIHILILLLLIFSIYNYFQIKNIKLTLLKYINNYETENYSESGNHNMIEQMNIKENTYISKTEGEPIDFEPRSNNYFKIVESNNSYKIFLKGSAFIKYAESNGITIENEVDFFNEIAEYTKAKSELLKERSYAEISNYIMQNNTVDKDSIKIAIQRYKEMRTDSEILLYILPTKALIKGIKNDDLIVFKINK